MGDDCAVSDDRARGEPPEPPKAGKLRERASRTDSRPRLVATAKFIRHLLPGDERFGDALSTTGGGANERIGRLLSEAQPERPSAIVPQRP